MANIFGKIITLSGYQSSLKPLRASVKALLQLNCMQWLHNI